MRKIMVCIAMAAVVFSIGVVPQRIMTGLNHYTVVTPQPYTYQPELSCNGVVMAGEGVKLMVSSNVVVKELMVEDGSWVEAGDVIAITQPPAPEQAFLSQSIDLPTSAFNPKELESLAAQYGMELPAAAAGSAADASLLLEAMTATQQATAPISGVLTWNSVATGRFVPAGSQLCTILGLDSYRAVVQVAADQAQLVHPGAAAVVTGSEIGNQQYTGTVRSVGNTITHGVTTGGYSSTVEVELVLLDVPPDAVRHGANITCTIVTGQTQEMMTLPYEAIHQDEHNREFVYCVNGSSLRKQYVETGLELDDCIQIVSGVADKTAVATGDAQNPDKPFMLNNN